MIYGKNFIYFSKQLSIEIKPFVITCLSHTKLCTLRSIPGLHSFLLNLSLCLGASNTQNIF